MDYAAAPEIVLHQDDYEALRRGEAVFCARDQFDQEWTLTAELCTGEVLDALSASARSA